ncbi:Imm32 family immunity protein [Xanthomonas axonopodis]|uniref:Imm32 family immunity protein n=1 Tax=Xanthomonas axonopodis TaxID=53413 RepID=UPI003FCCFE37
MKLFGYVDSNLPPEEVVPSELAEVTLCASPDDLRRIASFLNHCASEMDRMGPAYDHIHLSDQHKQFQASPHFAVCRD